VAAQGASGEGRWYPLAGVKSGQILLTADFLPLGGHSTDPDSGLAAAKRLRDNLEAGGKSAGGDPRLSRTDSKGRLADSTAPGDDTGPGGGKDGRKGSSALGAGGAAGAAAALADSGKNPLDGFKGDLCVQLVKARDLVKADIMGKSDPYAVLKFGRQKDKTNTIKNTLEPQWDFGTNFKVPDGDAKTLR
jgi:hypothetical protein